MYVGKMKVEFPKRPSEAFIEEMKGIPHKVVYDFPDWLSGHPKWFRCWMIFYDLDGHKLGYIEYRQNGETTVIRR